MANTDRNYVRFGPRASSGLGNLRVISFNTWLILINVVVFLSNNWVLNTPDLLVHTSMGRAYVPNVRQDQIARSVVQDVVKPDVFNPGWYYKPIVDPQTLVLDPSPGGPCRWRSAGDRFANMPFIESFGHFSTAKAFVPGFQVWRFITFQFLHYNWIHILFNMLGLWFVGGMVEQHSASSGTPPSTLLAASSAPCSTSS